MSDPTVSDPTVSDPEFGDQEDGLGVNPDDPPQLLVFDVNETLSDLAPMAEHFATAGAPSAVAPTWFAGVLRDGFALTITGDAASFADVARASLRTLLATQVDDLDASVQRIMDGFQQLPVHPDVVEGIRALQTLGMRMVTLSNGAASVAEGLLERSGLLDCFERVLSVEDAPCWKPGAQAYAHAVQACGREPRECMLVAAHPWDLQGARRAGLGTAWVNRTGADFPGVFTAPDLQAESLVDLAAQLGAVGA